MAFWIFWYIPANPSLESENSFLHSLFWWDENFLLLIDEAKGQGASVAEGLQKLV